MAVAAAIPMRVTPPRVAPASVGKVATSVVRTANVVKSIAPMTTDAGFKPVAPTPPPTPKQITSSITAASIRPIVTVGTRVSPQQSVGVPLKGSAVGVQSAAQANPATAISTLQSNAPVPAPVIQAAAAASGYSPQVGLTAAAIVAQQGLPAGISSYGQLLAELAGQTPPTTTVTKAITQTTPATTNLAPSSVPATLAPGSSFSTAANLSPSSQIPGDGTNPGLFYGSQSSPSSGVTGSSAPAPAAPALDTQTMLLIGGGALLLVLLLGGKSS